MCCIFKCHMVRSKLNCMRHLVFRWKDFDVSFFFSVVIQNHCAQFKKNTLGRIVEYFIILKHFLNRTEYLKSTPRQLFIFSKQNHDYYFVIDREFPWKWRIH